MCAQPNKTLADAQRFIRAAFGNEELQNEYLLKVDQGGAGGKAATADEMAAWFKSKGYETTLDSVRDEWTEQLNQTLDYYASPYNTYLNGRIGPTLNIDGGVVKLDDKEIVDPVFSISKLTWTAEKNSSSGSITFVIFDSLVDAQGHEVPEDADIFIGAQFHGTYAKAGQPVPLASNFYGRTGVFPDDFIKKLQDAAAHPVKSPAAAPPLPIGNSKLTQWADTYTVWRKDSGTSNWNPGTDKIVIAKDGTITYNGTSIRNFSFNGVLLTWQAKDSDPNNLTAIVRRVDHITATDPLTGNQLYGRLWTATEPEPPHGSVNMMATIGAVTGGEDASGAVARQASSNANAAQSHSFFLDLLQMALGMYVAHYLIEGTNKLGGWTREKIQNKWRASREKSRELTQRKTLEKAQRAGVEGVRRAGEEAQKRADKDEREREKAEQEKMAKEQHELEAEARGGKVQIELAQRDLERGAEGVRQEVIRGREGEIRPGEVEVRPGEPAGRGILEEPFFRGPLRP